MNILALDTSAATASAAVARDGYIMGEISLRHGKTHSQKVIPMMENLLALLDLKPEEISLMAVANGPGSFTGLRIGVVTVKAYAYALKIPVAEVSTLMALAYTLGECNGVICPVMDARNHQVYTGVYRIEGEHITNLYPDAGITIEALVDLLKTMDATVHFIGDAVPLYQDFIKEQGIPAFFAPDELFTHRASATARLAWQMQKDGPVSDAFRASPQYHRKSQAERMKGILRSGLNE